MKKVLVTGGAGFIGSNYIHYLFENENNFEVVNLDCLTYSANLENLKSIEKNRDYSFKKIDLRNKKEIFELGNDFTHIVHFAAESHVDRSVIGAEIFIQSNVLGTYNLLEFARLQSKLQKFCHVSTDEVYGSLGDEGKFTENSPIAPNSPYSASKASSDFLVRSFVHTYNLPCVITRCSNNYGPFQFPEKLIPLMTINALQNKKLPVYGTGNNVRDWIYVQDHCQGVHLSLMKGKLGEIYNIGGENEIKNIEIVKSILKILKKSDSLIEYVKDRPGHDWRYAIDCSKIKSELGYKPKFKFENAFEKTLNWYLDNQSWWEKILNLEYQKYYQKQYGERT